MEEFELEPGEVVLHSVRQHPFVLFMRILPFIILAIAPMIVLSAFMKLAAMGGQDLSGLAAQLSPESPVVRFMLGMWWLFAWVGAFGTFTRFYLTVWIITSSRIVDIKQYSFFNRQVSSFLLIRVQDVTTEIYGVVGTIVGYGRLHVETAGRDERFTMDGIAHPQYIRDVIMNQVATLHGSDAPPSGL